MNCDGDPEQLELVDPTGTAEPVLVHVRNDESARRIEAVLGALGFDVIRDPSSCSGDPFEDIAKSAARRHSLSEREHQVLLGVLRGHSTEDIAAQQHNTPGTIRWHLTHLYAKLGVETREQALRRVLWLDDGSWLEHVLMRREVIERLNLGVRRALAALRKQSIDGAIHELEAALADAQRIA